MDWTGCSAVGLGGGRVGPRVAKLVALDYWHGLEESEIARRRELRLSQVDEIIAFAFPLRPDEYGYDWTGCDEVEQVRNKVSGVSILKHTRLQAGAVVDNFKSGVTPAQISYLFTVPLQRVKAVLSFMFPEQTFQTTAVDWTGCSEVEQASQEVYGLPVLKGSSVQANAIAEGHRDGMTAEELADWFDVPKEQVQAVLDFAFPEEGKGA